VNVLLFGASGSAGGSVLRTCLVDAGVTQIRAVVRRSLGLTDRKLRQVIHADYTRYDQIATALDGVDACFFCLGKSVRQVAGEAEYRQITYEFALAAASALHERSPAAVFHYLSGSENADIRKMANESRTPNRES
jgi:uncharacterized protein YbjT (DUF2867 family)